MNKGHKGVFWGVTGGLVVVIAAGTWYAAASMRRQPSFEFIEARQGTVVQGVSITGTVKAAQDISLAFQSQGTVSQASVKAGDAVRQGQALFALDNKAAGTAQSAARAAVEAAEAAYNKIVNGATSQQVAVTQSQVAAAQTAADNAQKNLDTVKQQQDVLVANARRTMMNSAPAAIAGSSNLDGASITVSGTYSGDEEGSYDITIYATGSGLKFQATGLEMVTGDVRTTPQALGSRGLYIQFSTLNISPSDTWRINLPNTQAASYVANYNAYQAALRAQDAAVTAAQSQFDAAQTALAQAQAGLALQQTAARPEDVAAAKAQLDAARAQLQSASNAYSNGIITAPVNGVITAVNVKVGESASPGQAVAAMVSDEKYQIELYASEAQLGKIRIGDAAAVTLDAYGSGAEFSAVVTAIDPAATGQNGAQSYKVTAQFADNDDRIREGMGANVAIRDSQKDGAVLVPQADVFGGNGSSFVLVDAGGGRVKKQPVTAGLRGTDGMVEIISGLNAGDRVASF